jgi:hypothetical protein
MRAITYNDKAAHWSRSNHLTGARLLPSSDDSDNFSRTLLWNSQAEIIVNQNTPVTGIVQLYFHPMPLILCLFKAKVHICAPKMAEDELNVYSVSSQGGSQAMYLICFSALYHPHHPLYLAYIQT